MLAGGSAAVLGAPADDESKSNIFAPFDGVSEAAGKDGEVRGEGPPR